MSNVIGALTKAGSKVVSKLGPKGLIALGVGSTGALGAAGFGVWALVRHGQKKHAEKLERARKGGGLIYIEESKEE